MFLTGLIGFICGMIAGAVLNGFLLRHVPVQKWRSDRDLKLRYGALNWALGIVCMLAAIYLQKLASNW